MRQQYYVTKKLVLLMSAFSYQAFAEEVHTGVAAFNDTPGDSQQRAPIHSGDEFQDLMSYLRDYKKSILDSSSNVSLKHADAEIAATKLASTPKCKFVDNFTWVGVGDKTRKNNYNAVTKKDTEAKQALAQASQQLKQALEECGPRTQKFLLENNEDFKNNFNAEAKLAPVYKQGKVALEKIKKSVEDLGGAISNINANSLVGVFYGNKDNWARLRDATQAEYTDSAIRSAQEAVKAVKSYQALLTQLEGKEGVDLPKIKDSLGSLVGGAAAGYGYGKGGPATDLESNVRSLASLGQILELSRTQEAMSKVNDVFISSDREISNRYEALVKQREEKVAKLKDRALKEINKDTKIAELK